MGNGWIKLHRKIQDCWIWADKEPFDKRSAWIDLLITANHSDKKLLFNGELITVERGQILTSVRKLSEKWKWSVNKVYRFIKLLESDEMLQKESKKDRTLLTIVNYGFYQHSENTNENTNGYSDGNIDEYTDRTLAKTPTDTVTEHKQEYKEDKNDKECKEVKKEKKDTYLEERKQIIEYLNQRCGTRYSYSADYVKKNINARLSEKHTIDEFYEVIDKKYEEWQGTDMEKFLRPQTLFGTKFENYLSQPFVRNKKSSDINASKQSQLDYLLNSIREEEMNEQNGG